MIVFQMKEFAKELLEILHGYKFVVYKADNVTTEYRLEKKINEATKTA